MLSGIIILLLFVSIILLVFNIRTNRNIIFLCLLFFLLAIYSLTHFIVTENKSVFFGAIFYVNMTPLYLATGPVLYIYLRNTLVDKFAFYYKDWVHFLPTLIIFIGIIPYLLTPFEYKLEIIENLYGNTSEVLDFNPNLFFSHIQMFYIRLGSLTIYILFNIAYLLKHKREKFEAVMLSQKQKKITFNWLMALHSSLLAVVICYLLFVVQITLHPEQLNESLNSYVLNATLFFIGIMNLSLFFFPDILYGFPSKKSQYQRYISSSESRKKNKSIDNNDISINSYQDKYYINIQKEIEKYFNTKEEFLNDDFKMRDLLFSLNIPEHHVRYCFKNYIKKSFPQLKNESRIRWVAATLKNQTQDDYTIEAIGQKAGYQSKSAFYNNFKEIYGVTPQEYLKQHKV